MFQFHKGAIKRYDVTVLWHMGHGFNSIKVRLKVPYQEGKGNVQHGFNSIKVRLKVGKTLGTI